MLRANSMMQMSFFSRTRHAIPIVPCALAFVLGIACLFFVQKLDSSVCDASYTLINPDVRCGTALSQGEWDYEPLRESLLTMTNTLKEKDHIDHVSVYFRDLKHGPRFGIGEFDQFHALSLRKVPLLIAYLHMADLDRGLLETTLSFTGSLKITQNLNHAEETIQPNTPYTIRELLSKMILYSDNYSYLLLTDHLNGSTAIIPYYTFRDLGVLRMMSDPNGNFISIQSYASLFGVLYNTGYLSREMSQLALELLSQSTFNEGLVAGVPSYVSVAHKFGVGDTGTEDQLHDCGIVYHPATPYVLCIMTTGTDTKNQGAAIAALSKTVYEAVSSLSFDAMQVEGSAIPH